MQDLRSVIVVWAQGVRLLVRSKKTIFLSLLCLGYVGLVVLVVSQASRNVAAGELYGGVVIAGVFMGIIPFTTMFFSVASLADELDDRTFVYLFVRPVRRSAVLLGKYLAAATVSALMATEVVFATYLVLSVPDWRWRMERGLPSGVLPIALALAAAAVLAYAAIGVLCASALRRPFLTAMLFVVGLEGIVGNTPPEAGIRALTVIDGVRSAMYAWMPPDPGLSEFLREWSQERRVRPHERAEREAKRELQGRRAPRHLATVTLVSLIAAAYVWSRREYESRPKE
jgi:hypothetical protein